VNKHKIRYHSRKNSTSTAASTAAAAAAAARAKAFHIEDLANGGGSGSGGNTSGETCDFCLKFFAKKSQYYAHVNEAHQDLVSFWNISKKKIILQTFIC
jgi:hypothetical protein